MNSMPPAGDDRPRTIRQAIGDAQAAAMVYNAAMDRFVSAKLSGQISVYAQTCLNAFVLMLDSEVES